MTNVLALFWPVGLLILLLAMAFLSKRMGEANNTPGYYRLAYLGALLIGLSIAARIMNIGEDQATLDTLQQNTLWLILYNGLPAIALTLGLIAGWRYWSWLLAERD
ncbi:MAG: hypothetical protein D6737_11500 [Chloroflexi bacterium]|nr:MAG: hypothetical protein CUN54_03450 [Phototrophicales bacterium]RMF79439.1 MAG: hypothetical protein D6737_11500 [Chloroflexota bacterium]